MDAQGGEATGTDGAGDAVGAHRTGAIIKEGTDGKDSADDPGGTMAAQDGEGAGTDGAGDAVGAYRTGAIIKEGTDGKDGAGSLRTVRSLVGDRVVFFHEPVAIDSVYRQVMGLKRSMSRVNGGCAAVKLFRCARGRPQIFPSCFDSVLKSGIGGMSISECCLIGCAR